MRKKHPFRRALLATVGTVSGIVLLLELKPTTAPAPAKADTATPALTADVIASRSSSASSQSPSASPSSSKTSEKKRTPSSSTTSSFTSSSTSAAPSYPASSAPAKAGSAPSDPKTTSAAPTIRTFTGATAQTKYGPVQVRITLTGRRITGAAAVRSPDGSTRSRDISSTAIAKLDQETLAAQNADIDTVSGATYTSAGYITSLQSALDRAGV